MIFPFEQKGENPWCRRKDVVLYPSMEQFNGLFLVKERGLGPKLPPNFSFEEKYAQMNSCKFTSLLTRLLIFVRKYLSVSRNLNLIMASKFLGSSAATKVLDDGAEVVGVVYNGKRGKYGVKGVDVDVKLHSSGTVYRVSSEIAARWWGEKYADFWGGEAGRLGAAIHPPAPESAICGSRYSPSGG